LRTKLRPRAWVTCHRRKESSATEAFFNADHAPPDADVTPFSRCILGRQRFRNGANRRGIRRPVVLAANRCRGRRYRARRISVAPAAFKLWHPGTGSRARRALRDARRWRSGGAVRPRAPATQARGTQGRAIASTRDTWPASRSRLAGADRHLHGSGALHLTRAESAQPKGQSASAQSLRRQIL